MKAFMTPEMEINKFVVEDVIATSVGGGMGGDPNYGGGEWGN